MTKKPKNIAEIILLPSRFQVKGPPELVIATQTAVAGSNDPDTQKWLVMDAWEDWYVQCSVSQEWISIAKLCYWDVVKNEIYARPELVPALGWYTRVPELVTES